MSATLTIFSSKLLGHLLKLRQAGRLPSSFSISQITPAGVRPARRARSTTASVLARPDKDSAFPGAQREHMAGRARSSEWVAGSRMAFTVAARSLAEIPWTYGAWPQTDTVNAVRA